MKLLRLFLCLLASLAIAVPVLAQDERILEFDSHIEVNADASMLVTETIQVQAEGVDIRHGIYRDFPTQYKDRAGNSYTVAFGIVGVQRDGSPEAYHTESLSNGVRVYFGSSGFILPRGRHQYLFTYRTNRQLGFFDDHDELYWNVTGNGWKFPIDRVTATVVLPPAVRGVVKELGGYTGYQGEKGSNFTAERDGNNNPVFSASGLESRQGLTIVVTWPKGYFQSPSTQQKLGWFLSDNRAALTGVTGLVFIVLYYLLVWVLVGRDPSMGTVMPLYEPPADLSPGAMRYLEKMGFDNKVFTSAILGLASKGYLKIERDDSHVYHLIRNDAASAKLSGDEKLLAGNLFDVSGTLDLKQANHERLQSARKGLKRSLQTRMEKIWFITNAPYLWPGISLTVVTVAASMLLSGGSAAPVGLFMSIWLTGWTCGVVVLIRGAIQSWRAVRTDGPLAVIPALFTTLFSIPFLAGEAFGIFVFAGSVGSAAMLILLAAITSNVLFHYLLKAPTRAGRQVMDRVDGFKMFLSAAEGDQLNRMTPVARTPELFERFLPYALALGVENAWAQQFAQVLAAAAGTPTATGTRGYSPSWYSGSDFSTFSPSTFASSFASSFSNAVSSASTTPGSSSGSGGGGSSGGGGGGGGGGGW